MEPNCPPLLGGDRLGVDYGRHGVSGDGRHRCGVGVLQDGAQPGSRGDVVPSGDREALMKSLPDKGDLDTWKDM